MIGNTSDDKVYLQSYDEVKKSFEKTHPIEVTVAKRIYIEIDSNATTNSTTYCMDFHRSNTSPGLGCKSYTFRNH